MSWRMLLGFALLLLGAAAALCLRPPWNKPLRHAGAMEERPPADASAESRLRLSPSESGSFSRPTLLGSGLGGEGSGAVRRRLESASPEARTLFEQGMALLNSGKPRQAREVFQELIRSFPEDAARAPAVWAISLTYYQEGDTGNLHQAANQLISFRDAYKSEEDLEELVHAAMIDLPVILMQLMKFGPSEYERTSAAALASKTLQEFLERWPDDPQAKAVRASLAEVSDFLSKMNAQSR